MHLRAKGERARRASSAACRTPRGSLVAVDRPRLGALGPPRVVGDVAPVGFTLLQRVVSSFTTACGYEEPARVGSCACVSATVVTILDWMASALWQFFWCSASTPRPDRSSTDSSAAIQCARQ